MAHCITPRKNSACKRRRQQPDVRLRFILAVASACALLPGKLQAENAYSSSRFDSTAWSRYPEKPFAISAEANPLPPGEFNGENTGVERASAEINAGDEVSSIPRRFQYAFRLNLRAVYDDNIYLRHTDRVGDYYFAIEPGVTIGFGDIVGRNQNSIRLDYAPSIFIYGDNSDSNGIQHLIHLEGHYHFSRLALSLSQRVQLLEGDNQSVNFGTTTGGNTGPAFNLDAGGETQVNIYTTQVNFSYDLTGKTFLSGGASYTANDYEELISNETVSANLYLNYNYSPKLVVGLGGSAGYNWVGGTNPDQMFEQINVRLGYQISGKVTLDASGGVEFRQFEDNLRGGSYVSPVYELGATYMPFDGTSVTLRGSRRTMNSAVLLAQNYASTNITVGLRQRFFQRVYVGLSAGYENSDYFGTVEFVESTRSDNYFFLQPAVDLTLTRFWTVGVYYLYRQNDSSTELTSFYDNQFGVRTSLTF
ncbi:MAG: outer membrane beta-barrel protein [Verrucomicrobiota bacterium]|nr:outer membrane beta-barrel protein [Verrucomicrobiota bacterium]